MPSRDEVVGARQREGTREKEGARGRKRETPKSGTRGRDEDGRRRRRRRRASGGLGRNESEKDDEIGLCRRRRDSTERAGVPQTGRRLSGMQAFPPPLLFFPSRRSGGRAGSLHAVPSPPSFRAPLLLPLPPPPHSDRFSPRTELPTGPTGGATVPRDFTIHHYHRQLRHASASASARASERVYDVCMCVCVYVCGKLLRAHARARMRPRRRYVTSSHGNQCSWPPTRSHGAKPTRPASYGHLCASAPLTCLSLFLFFLDLSPVALLRATLSRPRVRFSSCEPLGFLFLLFFPPVLSSRPPAPLYLPALPHEDYALCPRAIFQYLRKSIRHTSRQMRQGGLSKCKLINP